MKTLLQATVLATATTVAIAAPAAADEVTVGGCAATAVVTACAFDTATVDTRDSPFRTSFTSCGYGSPVEWDGAYVSVAEIGPEITYDLPVTGSGTVIDWDVASPSHDTGYVEAGPELGARCP